VDHSGIEAVQVLTDRYVKAGKKIHLRHLSLDCLALLDRAGTMVEINIYEDPRYPVVDDQIS
jgi:SulP family sulfate permease